MTDIKLEFVRWPIGTVVTLYQRRSELHMDDMPPPQVPTHGNATVQADQSLTFLGLGRGSYWAIAPIAGIYRYVGIEIP